MGRKIYTVHASSWSPAHDGDAVFIREGFCWPAFLFGPLWALWFGMWRTAIVLFLVSILISGFVVVFGMTDPAELALTLGLQVFLGLWGNDWRRHVLARRGFAERGVISGRKLQDAEHHYFAGVR
jgi:hypothetical protein